MLLFAAQSATALAAMTRLDTLLVSQGLCTSRTQAKDAIKAGRVTLDGKTVLTKPALSLAEDAALQLAVPTVDYVSRAGEKLRFALDTLALDVAGAAVLDVGASTGGFTDCALQAGASSAVCIDVGHNQLHPKLQQDPRVTSLEGVNARTLTADMLPRPMFDLVVVDVSFISLQLVLPALWPLLARDNPQARLIALVKPQFEAGKQAVTKARGVVRETKTHERVVKRICEFAQTELNGCAVVGQIESPILGGDGNREFLLTLAPAGVAASAVRRVAPPPVDASAPVDSGGGEAGDGAPPASADDGLSPMAPPEQRKSAHSRASKFQAVKRKASGLDHW